MPTSSRLMLAMLCLCLAHADASAQRAWSAVGELGAAGVTGGWGFSAAVGPALRWPRVMLSATLDGTFTGRIPVDAVQTGNGPFQCGARNRTVTNTDECVSSSEVFFGETISAAVKPTNDAPVWLGAGYRFGTGRGVVASMLFTRTWSRGPEYLLKVQAGAHYLGARVGVTMTP